MNQLVMTQKIIKGATYVSLIGPLLGKYAWIPYADNNIEAGWICNHSKLKNLWCSTYTPAAVKDCIARYGGEIITIYADGLDFSWHEFKIFRESLKNHEEVHYAL